MDFIAQKNKRLIVRQKTSVCNIYIDNINFIQCEEDVSTIHFVDKRKKVIVSKRLKQFEKELQKYGYIRSAHNTLVNVLQIHEIKNGNARTLIMKNDEVAPITRRKLPQLKQILESESNHL